MIFIFWQTTFEKRCFFAKNNQLRLVYGVAKKKFKFFFKKVWQFGFAARIFAPLNATASFV